MPRPETPTTMRLIHPARLALRARAVHRLARQKRWPAYVFAAVTQELPHDADFLGANGHAHDLESLMIRAAHIALLYVSFTLID